jgi:hypothetical protein
MKIENAAPRKNYEHYRTMSSKKNKRHKEKR